MRKKIANFLTLLLLTVPACHVCDAAEVLLIDCGNNLPVEVQKLELACRFYGLKMALLPWKANEDWHVLNTALERHNPKVIVVSAHALSHVEFQQVRTSALRKKIKHVLIFGLTTTSDSLLLRQWSGGGVKGCLYSSLPSMSECYFSPFKEITRELGGQKFPLAVTDYNGVHYFDFVSDDNNEVQVLAYLARDSASLVLPTFVRTASEGIEFFLSSKIEHSNFSDGMAWRYHRERFFELAPFLMFLRHALGERCWHRISDDANFCIDDPWLTEPYGHLSYLGLLQEMKKETFHTTIAYIPWNWGRDEPEVVSLFQAHADKFSLCLHGNNHDHWEFGPARSLQKHEEDIQQALARIEKFKTLTGLSYDRVMVFPHAIAPEKTIGLLKKYNFLATVNTSYLPYGAKPPDDPIYFLSTVITAYENFPSFRRFPLNFSAGDIAREMFLDNPVIFYTHHDVFEKGIGAFTHTAKQVNTIQPGVKWRSLGDIARSSCLYKLRDDSNYEVLAFTNHFVLENKQPREVTYFVLKEESFAVPIQQLKVNNQHLSYNKKGRYLEFSLNIPPEEIRRVEIEYENDLDMSAVDISVNEWRVIWARNLSDFRDMVLSKNFAGRALIRFYYQTGVSEFWGRHILFLLVILFAIWMRRRRMMKRRLRPSPDISFVDSEN
jgi:hypothetical protein